MDPLSLTYAIGAGHNRTHVRQDLDDISAWANGLSIASDDLDTPVAQRVGLSQSGVVRSGAVSIATEQNTASATYTTLGTPDQVASVVVPANGLLKVRYLAAAKCTSGSAGKAAVFVGSSQLVSVTANTVSDLDVGVVSEATAGITANTYSPVYTGAGTFTSTSVNDATFTAFPTSGLIVQPLDIYVPAGTYTVSIRFKTSAGTLNVKDRRLWVEAVGF